VITAQRLLDYAQRKGITLTSMATPKDYPNLCAVACLAHMFGIKNIYDLEAFESQGFSHEDIIALEDGFEGFGFLDTDIDNPYYKIGQELSRFAAEE
jgi:hypothetical protein